MTSHIGDSVAEDLAEARRRCRATEYWGAVGAFPCDRCGRLLADCHCGQARPGPDEFAHSRERASSSVGTPPAESLPDAA